MTSSDAKAAKRFSYGCLAAIIIPIAIFGYIFVADWRIRNEIEKQQRASEVIEKDRPDPFAPDSIVYSYHPPGDVLGEKLTIVVCSENYDDAYQLMLQESDTNYKVAESLGKQLFNQPFTPESEYKQAFAKYILSKQEEKKLLFIPQMVKMQIIQKKYDGDPPLRSIYECRVLQPGSEGMIVYIRLEYLTTK